MLLSIKHNSLTECASEKKYRIYIHFNLVLIVSVIAIRDGPFNLVGVGVAGGELEE